MKPILITLSTLLFSFAATAQIPLDSIYTDSATWTNFYVSTYWGTSSSYSVSRVGYTFHLSNDTIVNATTYKKVYRRYIASYSYSSRTNRDTIYTPLNPEYIGRLRTDNRKVYFIRDNSYYGPAGLDTSKEYLLYDFGQQIGDTFSQRTPTTTNVFTLQNIDSIKIKSGQYLKKFTYKEIYAPYRMTSVIEGLGWEETGLLGYWDIGIFYQGVIDCKNVLCFESKQYSHKYNVNCSKVNWYVLENCFSYSSMEVENNKIKSSFWVYPNPNNGTFSLKGIPNNADKIEIYNHVGQLVYTENVVSKETTDINLSDNSAGLYMISISLTDNNRINKKLLIQ